MMWERFEGDFTEPVPVDLVDSFMEMQMRRPQPLHSGLVVKAPPLQVDWILRAALLFIVRVDARRRPEIDVLRLLRGSALEGVLVVVR